MSGIALFYNPRSRQNLRRGDSIYRFASSLDGIAFIADSSSDDSLEGALLRARAEGVSFIAMNGGDGSLHHVLEPLARVYEDAPFPAIALVRGGTMNTVAHSFGVFGTPEGLIGQLAAKVSRGQKVKTAYRRWLRVTVDGVTHGGFIFGTGIVPNFLEQYYKDKQPGGLSGAKLVARGLLSSFVGGPLARQLSSPQALSLSVDSGPAVELSSTMILASTTRTIGLGAAPFYRSNESIDRFHLLTTDSSPAALAPSLPWIWAGTRPPLRPFNESLPSFATIEPIGAPLSYTLDGDLYQAKTLLNISLSRILPIALPNH